MLLFMKNDTYSAGKTQILLDTFNASQPPSLRPPVPPPPRSLIPANKLQMKKSRRAVIDTHIMTFALGTAEGPE